MREQASSRRSLALTLDASVEGGAVAAVWLAALRDGRERTLRAIAGIDPAELDWRTAASRNSIGSLLYHIAAIELDWLYSDILQSPFPSDFRDWFPLDVRDDEGVLSRCSGEPLERHVRRLEYVRDKLVAAIGPMPDAQLRRPRRLDQHDVTPEWVLCHLLQHEAEHRGQISVLRCRYAETAPR